MKVSDIVEGKVITFQTKDRKSVLNKLKSIDKDADQARLDKLAKDAKVKDKRSKFKTVK